LPQKLWSNVGLLDWSSALGSLHTVRLISSLPSTASPPTAHCPLASPAVIDWEIDTFTESDLDYLSNTLMPTYPDGLDVEVVRTSVLTWAGANLTDPPERERVTLGVYRRPKLFTLGNVLHSDDLSGLRWTVDKPEDLEFVRAVYQRLYAVDPSSTLPTCWHSLILCRTCR
jgi:spore coat polysaccharide biosynthesis protein SpsF (cytidylyltransferase family)